MQEKYWNTCLGKPTCNSTFINRSDSKVNHKVQGACYTNKLRKISPDARGSGANFFLQKHHFLTCVRRVKSAYSNLCAQSTNFCAYLHSGLCRRRSGHYRLVFLNKCYILSSDARKVQKLRRIMLQWNDRKVRSGKCWWRWQPACCRPRASLRV